MSHRASSTTSLSVPGRFRSAYSEKIQKSISFQENSPHTRQEFRDECDINVIMAQYLQTGEFIHLNTAAPQYLDCTGIDFRQQMDFVAGAFSMFEDLPSKIRLQFDNDPAAFLEFCSQEKNRPELAQMGLLSPEAIARDTTPQGTVPVASPEAPVEPPADA